MSESITNCKPLEDLTGRVFGRLTVIEDPRHGLFVTARCSCPKVTVKQVRRALLLCGATRSCGCLHREMMSQRFGLDLTGKEIGLLTVISRVPAEIGSGGWRWLCRCECKKEKVISSADLRSGRIVSCGHYRLEQVRTRGGASRDGSLTYKSWIAMLDRCSNPRETGYFGRGITVCGEWQGENGYRNFLTDMGERPSRAHTLDRIDNDGPYCKDNCRWATKKEQGNNRRNSVRIEWKGQKMSLGDLEREGIVPSTVLYQRIVRNGWDVESALTTPVNPRLVRQRKPWKLSDDDVRAIRRRFDGGESQKAIGADFGVTRGTVSTIGRRLSRAGVT